MEEFMRRLHVVAIASFMLGGPASAADICKALALRDVPALEAPESILKRGEYDTAITQYRMNKKTGMTSFCSHGGFCYPTHVIENGAKVEVLRLTNCKIGKRDEWDDPEEILYSVDVLKSALSETEQKIDELDNKLLDLGLCSACASNVAHLYVRQPQSRCAALTRKALGGDAQALETLKQDPDYCR
jgi:hypothetical protein